MIDNRYRKLSIALKYYLHGAKYYKALQAFQFAEELSKGRFRKDDITPEFQHPIEIALYITTLKNIIDEEQCIIAALLHDVREDFDIDHQVIVFKFGDDIANDIELITKKYKGVEKTKDDYFRLLSTSACASLVKGVDRITNIQSMTSVFTVNKQTAYVAEVREYVLPILQKSAELYPEMFLAYMNVRTMLKHQTAIIQAAIDGIQFKDLVF